MAPNVEFFVDDLEDDWAFQTKFDLIYLRCMTGSFKDWPKFFRQAYEYDYPRFSSATVIDNIRLA